MDLVSAGCPGHGPVHLVVQSAGTLGFVWDSGAEEWFRPGLPPSSLAGPHQHFKTAVWDAWRSKVCFDLCRRQGFREDLVWMWLVLCTFCMLRMFGTGIRPCFGLFFLAVVGMDFFSVMPGEKSFLAASPEVSMVMGTFFGYVLTPLWFKFVKILSFMICVDYFGMADFLLYLLFGASFGWAVGPGHVASSLLETSLGA